jgi:hypothetical protein
MITAAALTFPRFRLPVTRVSGRRASPSVHACGATVVTCIYATKVTIYNCRIYGVLRESVRTTHVKPNQD